MIFERQTPAQRADGMVVACCMQMIEQIVAEIAARHGPDAAKEIADVVKIRMLDFVGNYALDGLSEANKLTLVDAAKGMIAKVLDTSGEVRPTGGSARH